MDTIKTKWHAMIAPLRNTNGYCSPDYEDDQVCQRQLLKGLSLYFLHKNAFTFPITTKMDIFSTKLKNQSLRAQIFSSKHVSFPFVWSRIAIRYAIYFSKIVCGIVKSHRRLETRMCPSQIRDWIHASESTLALGQKDSKSPI